MVDLNTPDLNAAGEIIGQQNWLPSIDFTTFNPLIGPLQEVFGGLMQNVSATEVAAMISAVLLLILLFRIKGALHVLLWIGIIGVIIFISAILFGQVNL